MSCTDIVGFVLSQALCQAGPRGGGTSSSRGGRGRAQQGPCHHHHHHHQPAMLSRLSSALQAAADVVAPPCPRVEELRYQWTQLSMVCQRCQQDQAPPPAIEETHIPRYLSHMLKVLVAEQEEEGSGGVGRPLSPCMEYLVQERVLARLALHACVDRPLGVRQHAYMFLVGVLNHLHYSHLHHTHVHRPLQVMVRASCEMRASPYEPEEMEFLATLCEKIRQDNSIILLYIQPVALTGEGYSLATPHSSQPPTPTSPPTPSRTGVAEAEQDQAPAASTQPKFPLVDALLHLCHSADSLISQRAHDCLLGVAGVWQGHSSTAVARHTLLPQYLASLLVTALDAIPTDTEPALIEDVHLHDKHRLEAVEGEEGEEEVGEFPGRAEVTTFLHWLHYCDQMVGVSEGSLGSAICHVVREVFLEGVLQGTLCCDDHNALSLHLALTTKMVASLTSPLLANCIISWLTEDGEGSEEGLRGHLLQLCQKSPHHLQIQTLRLLQVVLERPGSVAVQGLVLAYVAARGYYDHTAAEHQQTSWSDEEDERHKQHRDKGEMSPDSVPISRTLAPANINKIVKRFLSVVPEEVRSTAEDDFESYMADAQRQYKDVCQQWWGSLGWPREAVGPECASDASSTASRESRPEAEANPFHEGPFLAMLLDMLDQLPAQDYDINLQVTSLVASLALLPHPHLHEYLLNPTVAMWPGVRTPYTVLTAVVARMATAILAHPDYDQHLRLVRHQLLGTVDDLDLDRDEEDRKFEALVVVEEFTKELASIAYAKYITEGSRW